MGSGKSYSLHEIDETKASLADDAFEEILEKIKSAGGEIISDDEAPLYMEIGQDEIEVGYERVIMFNLNKLDFKLMRTVETERVVGEGRKVSLETMSRPRVKMKLLRKTEISENWEIVDLEDMF
jgi:hypothetical protein